MLKIKKDGVWTTVPDDYYVGAQGEKGEKGDKGDDTFVEVQYGVTSYAEVLALANAGKIPYFFYETSGVKHLYYYSGELGSSHNLYFFRTRAYEIWQCYVTTANAWTTPTGTTMATSSALTALTNRVKALEDKA